jgi:hypothetical protein
MDQANNELQTLLENVKQIQIHFEEIKEEHKKDLHDLSSALEQKDRDRQ